ncbi:MAG TPA: hypothetical protein VI306_00820 [Pyrinomonadaceae bacterium]
MSFLALYRPNFCAECGDKIFRLRWPIWTNRRFCEDCSPKFRRVHWTRKLLAVAGVLALGFVVGRAIRRPAPPLVIQRNVVAPTPAEKENQPSTLVDDAYICGARTKKGTPCSRRVHGPVRCWQHKGLPAMVPLEKLKIKE